jgi:hypothetical protein
LALAEKRQSRRLSRIWLKITPPKIVPRALVSRGSMVTRRVGSLDSAIR